MAVVVLQVWAITIIAIIKKMKIKKTLKANQTMKVGVVNKTTNLKQSFVFTAILSNLDLNIPDNASTLLGYSQGIFILILVVLLCFINVLAYLFFYIIIQKKKDYESKYPKLKKIINYYKNTNLIVAIIESILCLISLVIITFGSLLFIIKFIITGSQRN
jgi:hypothetical protein